MKSINVNMTCVIFFFNRFDPVKFTPKITHLWPYCLINPYAKCLELTIFFHFSKSSHSSNVNCFSTYFFAKRKDGFPIKKCHIQPQIDHIWSFFPVINPFAKYSKMAIFNTLLKLLVFSYQVFFNFISSKANVVLK